MELVEKKAVDLADQMWKDFETQYQGDAPGMRGLDDLHFRVWFETKTQQDYLYPYALEHVVAGGKHEVGRYLRVVRQHQEAMING